MLRLGLAAVVCSLALAGPAGASPYVRFGVHDDAWLAGGPGALETRVETLDRLGVDVVRVSLRWDRVAPLRPASPDDPTDPAYDWRAADEVLEALRARRIGVVLTLVGAPRWANGNRGPTWAPLRGSDFAAFAHAAARRYGWVRQWTVWDEPNRRAKLRPTSARVYVGRLLNPAFAEIHRAIEGARVGGGETAPLGGRGGIHPLDFMRGMRAAGAQLDAYAHHPRPVSPAETPLGPCVDCGALTLPTLDRLLSAVRRNFGPETRVWLTAHGYETRPPAGRGVSQAQQGRYLAEAALRAYRAPKVDLLLNELVQDERRLAGRHSGLFLANGVAKMGAQAFSFPLAQSARTGETAVLWGQVRPRSGRQPYRLQLLRGGRASWLGGVRVTSRRGYFTALVRAPAGALVRVWSPRDGFFGAPLLLR